jgi:adhesin transport system outer membrane protein
MAAERAPAGLRPVAAAALAASAPTPALRDATAAAAPTAARSTIVAAQRLQDWAQAWMSHNADTYLAFYAPEFKPAKGSRDAWMAERRRVVSQPGAIKVTLSNVQTRALGDTRVETSFDQSYSSPTLKDTMHKTLVWDRVDGEWKIVAESNR